MSDFNFKKQFGQNFLSDQSIVSNIVNVVTDKDCSDSLVIEVGPGAGILTKSLVKKFKNVLSYEIDLELKSILSTITVDNPNLEIKFKDFMQCDILNDISKYDYKNIYFVANVPYYITTAILTKLINSNIKFKKIVMMVQKEVGERYTASVCTKDYSSLTVLTNYYYDAKAEFIVNREFFTPVPNVDSMIVSFSRKDSILKLKNYEFFEIFVRDAFMHKRKNLNNNLKKYNKDILLTILAKYDLDLTRRAEEVPLEVFVELSNNLCE